MKKNPVTSTRKGKEFLVEPDKKIYFKVRPYGKFETRLGASRVFC